MCCLAHLEQLERTTYLHLGDSRVSGIRKDAIDTWVRDQGYLPIVKGQTKIILLVKSQSKHLPGQTFDWGHAMIGVTTWYIGEILCLITHMNFRGFTRFPTWVEINEISNQFDFQWFLTSRNYRNQFIAWEILVLVKSSKSLWDILDYI